MNRIEYSIASALFIAALVGAEKYPYAEKEGHETRVIVSTERTLTDYNSDGLVDVVRQRIPRMTSRMEVTPSISDRTLFSQIIKNLKNKEIA